MTATWHAPDDVLVAFVSSPESIDDVTASSVEAHLIACADCRGRLSSFADPVLTGASWDAVADVIDRPRRTHLERLGVRGPLPRLLGATRGLQLSGLAAVAALGATAAAVSRTADAQGPFLVAAPLAPLAMVFVAFAPAADPAGEAGVATPVHGVGLIVRRAIALLLTTCLVLGVAALTVPHVGWMAVAWVLPALALASAALAAATWVRIDGAVVTLGVLWLLGVSSARWLGGRTDPIATSPLFSAAGQAIALAVVLAAAFVLTARRDRYATMEAFR